VIARRILLAAALVLVACTDAGPAIGRAALTATLDSPNGDEGAAVIELFGEGVLGVRGTGATEVYSDRVGETTRVVLIHPTGGTLSFEVELLNRRRRPVAVVREVAGPDDELRSDLSGYHVGFTR
jgi:hypothetical protein